MSTRDLGFITKTAPVQLEKTAPVTVRRHPDIEKNTPLIINDLTPKINPYHQSNTTYPHV